MENRIIICGGNGAGKSTLGKKLAQGLGCIFMDIETYYFPPNNTDYNYATAKTREEVTSFLLEDMEKYNDFVLASVKGDYGEMVASMFTCAVFISAPKEIRMKRVRNRACQKFGDRILQGGDLYEREERFFDMVNSRSEKDVTEWLDSINVPIIRVDGTQPIEKNIKTIMRVLVERY